MATIEYDPNRSAHCAGMIYPDGEKRYILQPVGLKVGATVYLRPEEPTPGGQRAAAEEHSPAPRCTPLS